MSVKEMFNHHQFFSTHQQYVKIKLMQIETNLWSIFGKGEYRYLNNFQEHLFERYWEVWIPLPSLFPLSEGQLNVNF